MGSPIRITMGAAQALVVLAIAISVSSGCFTRKSIDEFSSPENDVTLMEATTTGAPPSPKDNAGVPLMEAVTRGAPPPPKDEALPARRMPTSCEEWKARGKGESGQYTILVAGKNISVWCDMKTYGGGWTVLQRRGDFDKVADFFKKWNAYKYGFGITSKDHWVGLEYWNNITLTKPQQLLIQLEDWEGNKTEIAVNNFIIGP